MHNVTPEDLEWANAQVEEVLLSARGDPGMAREILGEKFLSLRPLRSTRVASPPGQLFWARLLAASVRPAVEGARQEIFGKPVPPFARYLPPQPEERPSQRPRQLTMRAALERFKSPRASPNHPDDQLNDALAWLEHQKGSPATTEATATLRYWDADGVPESMPAASPQLQKLAQAAEIVTFYTRWPPEASLVHILCGAIPVGSAQLAIDFQAAPNSLQDMGVKWLGATVQIFPWHLTRNLREVVGVLAAHPPLGRRLTARDLMLLDLVAVLGEPPPARSVRGRRTGRKSYWDQVVNMWLKRYGQKVAWGAIRMQWERLESRFPKVTKLLQEEGDR